MRTCLSLAALAVVAHISCAQAAKPIVLKFGFPPPPKSWINTRGITPWANEVARRTKGEVRIRVFGGGSVVNFRNVYDRVLNSVVDIGYGALSEVCQKCVHVDVADLPFQTEDPVKASRALWHLVADGTFTSDFAQVKPLAVFTYSASVLNTKRPVTTLNDMKGLKLLASGRLLAEYINALGAVPITLTNAQAYSAIQRDVVGGSFMSTPGIFVFKLNEVTKYHLYMPLGLAPGGFFMNKKSFARLPDSVKAVFDATTGAPLSEAMGKSAAHQDEFARGKIAAAGGEFKELSQAQLAVWKKRLDPVVAGWVRKTPDGAKVLAAYGAELAKEGSPKQ